MRCVEIKTAEEMIDYLIDCTLATVVMMIDKKNMPKGEFERQCGIAQKGIDFLGKKYPFTGRARQFVITGMSVENYYSDLRKEWMAARQPHP